MTDLAPRLFADEWRKRVEEAMMARPWKLLVGPVLVVCTLSQQPTTAQGRSASAEKMAPIEQYLMDRNAEIALARSAAPKAISGDATVLVLTRSGFETAVKGKNGFVCLVDRSWQAAFAVPEFWNPKVHAPTCYNPQAVRSVMPVFQKRTEWALAGLSKMEIIARLKTAFEKQELESPEPGAMAYMMSKQQYISDSNPQLFPHVMFYMPNRVTAADWGANLPQSPVSLHGPDRLPDGTPELLTVFVVPVAQWSDASNAPPHKKP
jgi:hypothetical protein